MYKNSSAIKKLVKWLIISTAIFAIFIYLVIATAVSVVIDNFQPPARPNPTQIKK